MNPFKKTVDAQLEALAAANDAGRWSIPKPAFSCLAETAPDWPQGDDVFRLFRIRFGWGSRGVRKTFKAHVRHARRVLGEAFFQDEPGFRLDTYHAELRCGDALHHPIVEWIIADFSATLAGNSLDDMPFTSLLADEALVMAWLFPERLLAIDGLKWPAWLAAGYLPKSPSYREDDVCLGMDRDDRGGYLTYRVVGHPGCSLSVIES